MDHIRSAGEPNAVMSDGDDLASPSKQQRTPAKRDILEPKNTTRDSLSTRKSTSEVNCSNRQKLVDSRSSVYTSGQLNINDITPDPKALVSAVKDQSMSLRGERDYAASATGRERGTKSSALPVPEPEAAEKFHSKRSPSTAVGRAEDHRYTWRPPNPGPSALALEGPEVISKDRTRGKLNESGPIEQKRTHQAQTWLGGVDDDRMYTHGPARMIQTTGVDEEGFTLALQLSHELAQKMRTQIEAGRKFRAAREAVGRRTKDLIAADFRLHAEQVQTKEELDEYLDLLGEKELTPEEESKATAMQTQCNDMGHKRAAMKKELEQLPRILQEIQNTWMKPVEEVNAIQEDVFVKAKLVPATTELERLPWEKSQDGGTDVVAPDYMPRVQESGLATVKQSVEATRPGLGMRNRFTKAALEVAREKHDKYRLGYEKELQEYVAKQVNRPNVDFRIEFSRKWLEGWHNVIVTLEEAENAAQDAFDRARAANVTVADSRDDGVPTIAYDIEWWDKTSLKQLDRTRIQRWQNEVVVGVLGPTHPAGSDEAELEQLGRDKHVDTQTAEPANDNAGGAPVNPSERQPVAGSEGVAVLPALVVSEVTATPLQKMEQLLAEVAGALDRASELTSLQAHKPGLASAATGAEADQVNKQTSAVHASSLPREAFADVGAESFMAEVIDRPRQVVSQGNPGTQNTAQNPEEPQTSKGRTEQAVISEPKKRQDGVEIESQCETDLKGYMKKYNIPPPPVSRKRDRDNSLDQRDAIITASERAYGSRRRRIDKWGKYIRGGDC